MEKRVNRMGNAILVVVDDPNVLASLCRALRKEPYEVITATSADAAFQILGEKPVDVIISDEEMPGTSGIAFLKQVCRQHPDTVRFMLTGKATLQKAIEAINEGGISRFFTKPCNSRELAVCIRQGLRERDLIVAAKRLLQKGRSQAALIEQLEKQYPSITRVNRDTDGAILLENTNGDLNELMQEIDRYLCEDK